jgi:hypothetical protein
LHFDEHDQIWQANFTPSSADLTKPGTQWSVYVEEVERLRPGRYADEPRPGTDDDTAFIETGPRFAARVALDALIA